MNETMPTAKGDIILSRFKFSKVSLCYIKMDFLVLRFAIYVVKRHNSTFLRNEGKI